jgi:hypothetical protein
MTCDTLTAVLAASCAPAFPAGTRTPTGNGAVALGAACGGYIIYALEDIASGRHYVGLTRRTLAERIASHLAQAKRKGKVRDGGLMAALRLMMLLGQRFEHCYSARIVARAETVDEARELERTWIDLLNCRTPSGLNGMPGGSSVGAIHNARCLSVAWTDSAPRSFPSIRSAVEACNAERRTKELRALDAKTVYARIAAGWPIDEAVGLEPRRHPRDLLQRPAFAIGSGIYSSLRTASHATGLLPAALRSRLHRARKIGGEGLPQIGEDRRAKGPGCQAPLEIPWPCTGERLSAKEYSARTRTPKATIMHRWHRVREAVPEGKLAPPEAVHAFLTMQVGGKHAAALALARLLSQAEPPTAEPMAGFACEQPRPETQ